MSYGAKGVPAYFISVGPTTAANASSEGWRLCLCPNNHISGFLCDDTFIGRGQSPPPLQLFQNISKLVISIVAQLSTVVAFLYFLY
jgi:hypothetical protein